ncbi:MAG: T9SS type A sorting domain-containing protein [candidate division Zixibacteria bacterium]|nr:T9SS type A sorting domain-containing protein [candidate division Zixibacteria bacterium]
MATSGANPYFDSACVNQSFGHTFEGCWPESCWVIGATLCMKLKATGVIPHTDKLYLGEWDGIGASWAIELNDLENFAGGTGPWSSGDVMTVCLDLANLPAAAVGLPQNILAGLRDGRLDVLISDDTEVDYLELIVEICCPYGSICGTKFNDLNGNGIQDVGEEGLPNWTITLDDEDQSYTQVTGPNGEYCFTELASGHYSVYEMNQAGWTQMYPHFEKYEIDLPTSGTSDWAVEDVDFGNYFCETEITTDTCFAGAYDDFVGAEPSSPDAALLEVMGTLSSGANPYFDSVCINQGFGHTFSCWPESCQVVGATLCMRLKATGVIPHTDKLYLGEWDGIGAFWAIELNDLEDLAGGTGPWSSGDVMTVCLDLANLPATGLGTLQNLLGELQAGRLDVLIQDDTEVDYLELIVETCCEATVPDHGVIIVEPSGPGAGEGDTLYCDEPLTFDIHLRNHYDTTIMAIANGFRLYSPDGATWETPVYNSTGSLEPYLDFGVWVNGFSVDGVSDDTISLGGLAAYNGIPNGFDAVVMTIGTRFDESQAGKTVCIDSTFFPPIGTWMWACTGGSLIPDWGGPYCWTIADPDACCVDDRGNVDGDPDDIVDISDLTYLVDYMFTGGPPPPCPKEADLNGDGGVDIADLVYFVDYMFTGGPAPVPCDYMPPPAKVSGQQADISFDIEYANGISTVVMNSPIDLRGIQLELKGTGPAPANLVGEHVDMIHGRDGWVVKVGLLDLDGGEIISADTREVVRFEGKYTLEAVIVADVNARSITPTIGSVLKQNELPAAFTLSQNYPNPFNPSTSVRYTVPRAGPVDLTVYDASGRLVRTLIGAASHDAGRHSVSWDGRDENGVEVATGVYFARLTVDSQSASSKMVLLK